MNFRTTPEPNMAADSDLIARARDLVSLAEGRRAEVERAAQRLSSLTEAHRAETDRAAQRLQRAEADGAVTRGSLGDALCAAQLARAEDHRTTVAALVGAYARTGRRRARRVGRLNRLFDRVLARLGRPGQALVVLRSGVWSSAGDGLLPVLRRFRQILLYVAAGPDPRVQPAAPFDQAAYVQGHQGLGRVSPLVHYLTSGAREGRSPHPLFDVAHYSRQAASALVATGLSPLEHFVRQGAAQGLDPHPLFSIAHYLGEAPDLAASGENPLSHHDREAARREISPHPLFDVAWYRARLAPDDRQVPPLTHYVQTGAGQGLKPHVLFDPDWYLDTYPDVAAAGLDPLSHFANQGGREGRSPGPWFDTAHYLSRRGSTGAVNPLVDYLSGGAWLVGEPRPGFPALAYLTEAPDLVRAGLTPLEHWARRAGS